jgi:hypothetical protein
MVLALAVGDGALTFLIERSLAQGLDGEAAVAFEPGGVERRVRAALP